jgi:hypothetical protein
MKNFIPFIITVIALLFARTLQAQVSNYTFTQGFTNYGPSATGTIIGTDFQDDDVNSVALPFPFYYNGNTYTAVNVCANGYLSFNNISGLEYQAISNITTSNIIAPFAQDLLMGTLLMGDIVSGSNTITNVSSTVGINVGDVLNNTLTNDFPSNPTITAISGNTIVVNLNAINTANAYFLFILNGSISYNIIGAAPNRVCQFEFRNMERYMTFQEQINFKVNLYENSSSIEFVYGNISPHFIGIPSEVGLKGNSNTDFNSRRITSSNTWSSSIASTLITHNCSFSGAKFPLNGLSYFWDAPACTTPTIFISQISPTLCFGETTTLTATGATTYSWSNGIVGSQIVISPSVTTSYTVIGYDLGCASLDSINQPVITKPVISIVQSNTLLCTGESATLTATGATSYSWSNGTIGSQIVISPSVTTSYTVIGYDLGCESLNSINQPVITKPVISIVQSNTLLCVGESATITASGANSYSWSNGSNNASVSVSPSITTTYSVIGSNSNCLTNKSFIQNVDMCTNIEKVNATNSNIHIYPNPFKNSLNINVSNGSYEQVILTDMIGNIIYNKKWKGGASLSVDTELLKAGVYFITIRSQDGAVSKKIIKE